MAPRLRTGLLSPATVSPVRACRSNIWAQVRGPGGATTEIQIRHYGLFAYCKWYADIHVTHIVARPVRKKTNWVFAVGRLTACDALAASLCGLVVRVGEYGEVSKACAVQRAASAVVSSSPFVQQASLGSSSGGWMTPAAGWHLSRPHNGRQWLNRSGLTYLKSRLRATSPQETRAVVK